MAEKSFTNNAGIAVNVTLLIRQGNDIQKPSLEQQFTLNAGETKMVPYGNASNIYLNGLVFDWKNPKTESLVTQRQEVIATGVAPTFDWVLNTHSRIVINSLSELDITASN